MENVTWGEKTPSNMVRLEERCAKHDVWLKTQFSVLCRKCASSNPPNATGCRECGSLDVAKDLKSWFDYVEENRGGSAEVVEEDGIEL